MVVFVGPCPVLCVVCGLLSDETQIWLGDLRVVLLGACFLFVCLVYMWIAATYMDPCDVLFVLC